MGNASESLIKSGAVDLSAINSKPSALILDDKGRAIDSSGKAVSMMSRMPTLKANIRAKKREAFLKVEKPTDDFADKNFFDARVRLVLMGIMRVFPATCSLLVCRSAFGLIQNLENLRTGCSLNKASLDLLQ